MGQMRDSHQPVTTWAEESIVVIRYQATTSEDNAVIICSYKFQQSQ
jgi:hypothetical protein